MSLTLSPGLCIAGVICCSTLALHLLWVAALHRRSRPTVVNGELDFAATLAGLAGFLIVGGLVTANGCVAWYPRLGGESFEDAVTQLGQTPAVLLLALAGYWLLVSAVIAYTFWARRATLEVHHIDPASVLPLVDRVVTIAGLEKSGAVSVAVRPSAGHATVRVRRLAPIVAAELLQLLTDDLADAPTPRRSAGGRYTAAAFGLLGCTLVFFVKYFHLTRII